MTRTLSRRRFMGTAAATGAVALSAPSILRAANGPIKVGTYGGFFEESFKQFIFPEFTAATGIEVNSMAVPTGETWLVQIKNAARAKTAPADVSLMAGTPRNEGAQQKLFQTLDESKLPNLSNLNDRFQDRYDDGGLYGVGALSWYITLCTNSDEIPEAPTSWAALWDEQYKDQIGVLGLASNSFLLEVTAATHFGGTDILSTKDGIQQCFDKIAEMVPNVRLWYKDEGAFQQALQDGEIPMGQYYHDVAGLAAAEGFPVVSTFPKEGGVLDSGYWIVPQYVEPLDEVHAFIDFMSTPETQALLARNVGTAPVVNAELTDLTEEELAAVGSPKDPIIPRYDIYQEHADWISDTWNRVIAG
ncbi:extracellular solute-binding protein [Pseudohalocynthiibacter aestuariivivens]|uniref:Extracellular solute-binding protein n=1 Tax=Roseovarius pelagicus TaxID=2980108 RepID=A0ABY6DCI2_9RHOB|nr:MULTISPECIES: extracellular solute-binding protein [Rhodobacterales]QIE44259.1 extracellular solute-binding protein [Pseudohalocynthiibacter aestuariivivens]UXX83841.1 extracellular solute-binding protein [Roseovarius pelagicus]